jgi:hypothetical protein
MILTELLPPALDNPARTLVGTLVAPLEVVGRFELQ